MSSMSKRARIIFTVSIVLNVLLLSMTVGHVYHRLSSHSWHAVKADLAPETRNIVGRTFQSAFREIRPLGQDARKARADLVKILSAKEFDEAAFDKTVARLSTVKSKMRAAKIQATKELAMQLSVEERRKMAQRMAKMAGGGHEKRVKRHRNVERIRPDRPRRKPVME